VLKQLLLFCFLLNCVWAKAQMYSSINYTTKNGLVNNRCGNIIQDGAGYMWIGTDNGICNFNGKQFIFFAGNPNQYYWGQSIPSRYKQYALLGTYGQGLALCYKNSIKHIGKQFLSTTTVTSGIGVNDSTFLITTDRKKGVAYLSNNHLHYIKLPNKIADTAIYYFGLRRDKNNTIWTYTNQGIIVFKNGDSNQAFVIDQLMYKYINWITETKDGRMIIASGKNLFCMDIDGVHQKANIKKVLETPFEITCIETLDDKKIVIGGGTFPLVLDSNYTEVTKLIGEKASRNMWQIFSDREKNIWIASEDGISKFSNLNAKIYSFYNTQYYNIKSGTFTDKDFWVSNNFDHFSIDKNKRSNIKCNVPYTGFFEPSLIYTFDGKYFINGAYHPGQEIETIECLRTKNNSIQSIEKIKKRYKGPMRINANTFGEYKQEHAFFLDEIGKMWLYKNNKMVQSISIDPALKAAVSLAVHPTKQEFWITSIDYGIRHYSYAISANNQWHATLLQQLPNDNLIKGDYYSNIIIDPQETVWLGSIQSGLHYLRIANNGMYEPAKNIRVPQLSSNYITAIHADNQNNIWVGTNNGINKLSYNQLPDIKIKQNVFYESLTGTFIYFLKIKNNQLFIGTTGSVVQVQLNELQPSLIAPIVNINSISINGVVKNNLLDQQSIQMLQPQENNIKFEFHNSSYNDEQSNQFSYQLEGSENHWTTTKENVIIYNQLPAGDYTLRVRAKNASGVWSATDAVFAFVIKTPFYKQWWFIVLCLLLLAGMLYRLYTYRLKQALALQQTRNTISKDLHDDIGTSLSSITMMNELLKLKIKQKPEEAITLANKMEIQSREMIQNMNDIVWSINPENDSVDLLITRLHQFASDMFDASNTEYNITVSNATNVKLQGISIRRDIYLICKEIIANAAKYAHAKQLTIEVELSKNKIEIKAIDDGIGFDEQQIKRGNGLTNISKRAMAHGGTADVQSGKNGTRWMIVLHPNQ
jgi:ligand-binding sensor domain-containing protein/two-component sensor histidine kinase